MELMLKDSSKGIRPVIRWLPLVALLLVGLVASSCFGGGAVQGGWSGGTLRGDTLYLGSRDGRLIAVNVAEGSREWATPLETGTTTTGLGCSRIPIVVTIYGTPAVSDNLVYVGGYNGKVYSFIPGEVQPDRDLAKVRIADRDIAIGQIVGSVVVEGDLVCFADADGKVYGVNSRLQPVWPEPFQTGGKIWSTPTIQGATVYVGSFDRKVYALDAANGNKRWEFIVTTPVVEGGTVYVGSFDRHLYALDAASGSLKWQFEARHGFWARPIVFDGRVYAPSLDGKVYILGVQSGEEIDQVDLGAPVSSSPALVGKAVVVATEESRGTGTVKSGAVIWSIDTTTNEGRELARLPGEKLYAALTAGPASVYVHTDRDSVYGIDVATGAVRQFTIK
jgi:outer membrane protein assembly factor BamB